MFKINSDLQIGDTGYTLQDIITGGRFAPSEEVKTVETFYNKPVYRSIILDNIGSVNTWKNTLHNISNIETVVSIEAFYIHSGNFCMVPNDGVTEVMASSMSIASYNTNSYLVGDSIYYFIKYTKTTD